MTGHSRVEGQSSATVGRALSLTCALAGALVISAALELLRVPHRIAGVFALTIWHEAALFAPVIALQLALALSSLWTGPPLAHRLVVTGMGFGCAALAYRPVIEDVAFVGYWPLLALYAALGCYLALAYLAISTARPVGRWLRVPFWSFAVAGALGASYGNYTEFVGQYAPLHLSIQLVAFLLLHAALCAALPDMIARLDNRAQALARTLFALAVFVPLACAGLLPTAAWRPYFLAYTFAGQYEIIHRSLNVSERGGRPQLVRDAARDLALFERHNGLPRLPPEFSLQDYNVVLISVEATRFDETSLAAPAKRTTPRLLEWAQRRGQVYTRAYSPSSGTLHAMSAVHAMTYPSSAYLTTWYKSWHGVVGPENLMAAEVFQASGYQTLWVGHGKGLASVMQGFEQGFETVRRIPIAKGETGNADREIANQAIDQLRRAIDVDRRFFAWLFLISPHSGYGAHFDDWPAKTPLDLYRQELRFMDQQLGRILQLLESPGVAEKTIVIFMGDHGEEFREHGGGYHKSTVYSEVLHVPLVLQIPGLAPARFDHTTSTMYLFPWLFMHGDEAMQSAARARIEREIGPMLHHTDGAVVGELIGHDRMRSTLIYDDVKVNYDFGSELVELYAIDQDPREQEDIFPTDTRRATEYGQRVERYLQVRAANRRFEMDLTKGAVEAKAEQQERAEKKRKKKRKKNKNKNKK